MFCETATAAEMTAPGEDDKALNEDVGKTMFKEPSGEHKQDGETSGKCEESETRKPNAEEAENEGTTKVVSRAPSNITETRVFKRWSRCRNQKPKPKQEVGPKSQSPRQRH